MLFGRRYYADRIAAWIHDVTDEENLDDVIDFESFNTQSVRTETATRGDFVKKLRGDPAHSRELSLKVQPAGRRARMAGRRGQVNIMSER